MLKEIFFQNSEELKKAKNEEKLLKSINFSNIVKYYKSYQEENSFFILMEFCENSDLRDFIAQHKKDKKLIDKNVIYFIILDICSGLKEIHNKNIIHRDLNPNNIFISKDYKIKIGDFGISKKLMNTNNASTNFIGIPGYMAPELLDSDKYNNKVDIWSLGCIIYELCTLKVCFELKDKNINGYYNKIKEGIYERNELLNNSGWSNIIENLFKKNKGDRPDIKELYDLVINQGQENISIEQNYLFSLDKISRNILINKKQVNIIETNLETTKQKLLLFIG